MLAKSSTFTGKPQVVLTKAGHIVRGSQGLQRVITTKEQAAARLGGEGQDLARDAVGERLPGGPHGRHRRGAAHHDLQQGRFLSISACSQQRRAREGYA